MRTGSGTSLPLWPATSGGSPEARLEGEAQADVCVVGAGMAGLSSAYLLAREGRSVIVLDHGPTAGGETSRTTAHLSSAIDDRFHKLERVLDADRSRLAYASHQAAIEQIGAIVNAEGIDCSFERVDGFLFQAPGVEEGELERELEAARRAGASVERLASFPHAGLQLGPCLRFAHQGMFHPLRYLAALAGSIVRRGGRIFTNAHVDAVEDGAPVRVRVEGERAVLARDVIVATNAPISTQVVIHSKQAPYRTYAIGAEVQKGAFPRVLLWDTGDPYHYVRVQPGDGAEPDVLIAGGEDHKTGQANDAKARYERLEAWTRQLFPGTGPVRYRWSGQVLETFDGLAHIGRQPGEKHVWLATGDSGMGMTHGMIAGILLSDLIQGRENAWAELYDPSRKPLKSSGEYLQENLNVAAQYADLAKPGDIKSSDDLAPGAGGILRRGLKLIAVHRDMQGVLHERSAICTHLGCVVRWNSGESSWDCPCHGSRFAIDGHPLNGPAHSPLGEA